MRIKVLVVEDNISLNRSIVNVLQKEDYEAFGAVGIDSAKEIFSKEKPHIILLDIMLPEGHGYKLITFFQDQHEARILMLTALNDEQSKRISYENGADDYITKPFDLYELVYKLNAIKRRIRINSVECQIGDITFNTETHLLACKQETTVIQPSQMRLLKLLYDKYQKKSYVAKNEVLDDFSEEVNEANRLQTLVSRLRKNLSIVGSEHIDIETIYGKGYRIVVHQNRKIQKT